MSPVLSGTGRQYSDSIGKALSSPVQAPVLIVSTAPVSASTGTVLRPLLKSDWVVGLIDGITMMFDF